MVAGSIPGHTQTLPLAFYAVQTGATRDARSYTLLLTFLAFLLSGITGAYQQRLTNQRGE